MSYFKLKFIINNFNKHLKTQILYIKTTSTIYKIAFQKSFK